MNRFVNECRREWKRLRVPDAIANEMAADLTADLQEAEAEGASIEDVLGSSAFDPVSFATSWAAERGVSQPPAAPATPTARARSSRRWLTFATLAAIAVALVGALMVVAPRPRLHVGSAGNRLAILPHSSFLAPPPGITAHASNIANHLHTLGALVLIVGVIAMIATLALIWRTRGSAGSGWNSPSAA